MIHDDGADDPMLRNLRLLRQLPPDPGRADRVRARCRAQLQRKPPAKRLARTMGFTRETLVPVAVGGLYVLYVAGLFDFALRLHSTLK